MKSRLFFEDQDQDQDLNFKTKTKTLKFFKDQNQDYASQDQDLFMMFTRKAFPSGYGSVKTKLDQKSYSSIS